MASAAVTGWRRSGAPEKGAASGRRDVAAKKRTVSHICSLICLLSMLIMRAPNSTPLG